MRAAGLAVAVGLAVAPPAVAAHGARHARAAHAPAPRLVRVSCPEALADGSLADAGAAPALAALAAGLRWGEAGRAAPSACHREVRLHCGPDLDRDGDPEAIVEITSRDVADGEGCDEASAASGAGPPATVRYTFLVSRRGATWRAVAPLAVAEDDSGGGAPAASFVRQGRKLAVRVDRRVAEGACQVRGYELYELRAGVLHSVGSGDASAACVPCGCC